MKAECYFTTHRWGRGHSVSQVSYQNSIISDTYASLFYMTMVWKCLSVQFYGEKNVQDDSVLTYLQGNKNDCAFKKNYIPMRLKKKKENKSIKAYDDIKCSNKLSVEAERTHPSLFFSMLDAESLLYQIFLSKEWWLYAKIQ